MTVEEEVLAAAMGFYEGINDMSSGKGVERISAAWEHSPRATSRSK